MVFKKLCVFVLWAKVASALEGFRFMVCDGHLGSGAVFGEVISAIKTKEGWRFILIGSPLSSSKSNPAV